MLLSETLRSMEARCPKLESSFARYTFVELEPCAGPLNVDLKVPMIATCDIGTFAADELLRLQFRGHQTQELLGQRDLTMTEVTTVIGKAIGQPELQYRQITYDQFRGVLMQMGASPGIAELFVEMSEALNSGHVRALQARSQRNTTPTSYERFVEEEFVPAYQATVAGAARSVRRGCAFGRACP